MFPPAHASIQRNEAGEPTGWDVPAEPEYCDIHGITFYGDCPACIHDYDDLDDEED